MLKKGLTLPEIREIFRTKADKQLVEVLGKRLELSRLVEKLKREGRKTPDHIYNAQAEEERLNEAGAYAKELGINPYPYKFDRKHLSSYINKKYFKLEHGDKSEEVVVVAGRILQYGTYNRKEEGSILGGIGNILDGDGWR